MIVSKNGNFIAREVSRYSYKTAFSLFKIAGHITKDGSVYYLHEGRLLYDYDACLNIDRDDFLIINGNSIYDYIGRVLWDNKRFQKVFG